MSTPAKHPTEQQGWIRPMQPRSSQEEHRAATPLELFFDLVFVVAVAQAAARLHHGLAEAHVTEAVVSYAMVFFAIWWAWMNFTWFASAYDNDDVPYRLAVFVQMTGALILATGVPPAFDAHDFRIVTVGYGVMRVGAVAQWLRAAQADTIHRPTANRYAIGVSLVQVGWFLLLFFPATWRPVGFVLLVVVELAVPIWAEQVSATTWHPGHIVERYGLFTIIVLGESILAASLAIQSVIEAGDFNADLVAIIVGGLLIVFALWWFYFDRTMDHLLTSLRAAFVWGYGHLFIFAAAAAVGAGLAVAVDRATHHAEIGALGSGAAVAVPVAIYLIGLWVLHQQAQTERLSQPFLLPIVALLVLLTPLVGQAVLLTGLLLTVLLISKLVNRHRGRPQD